jgi:putative nucleotidyltransferase with HDIG domain
MADLLLIGESNAAQKKLAALISRTLPNWSVHQVLTSDAALEHIQMRNTDIAICRFDEHPASYEPVFKKIRDCSAHTLRFALVPAEAMLLPDIRGAHQVLVQRDEQAFLVSILLAAEEVVKKAGSNPALARIVTGLEDVPSPPVIYFDIREQVDENNGSITAMADIAARDPSLVARILKTANSGFYGLPRTVSSLEDALSLIGTDALLGMVLAVHLYSGLPPPGLKLEVLWQHSVTVSQLARQLARLEGANHQIQSECAVAGLLHDIGLLILLENEPALYQPLWLRCNGDEFILADLERDTFGVTHGELGAMILKLWSLPDTIVNAVADSHTLVYPGHEEMPLASRAILAAEWFLDNGVKPEAPASLTEIGDAKLLRWRDEYENLAGKSAVG